MLRALEDTATSVQRSGGVDARAPACLISPALPPLGPNSAHGLNQMADRTRPVQQLPVSNRMASDASCCPLSQPGTRGRWDHARGPGGRRSPRDLSCMSASPLNRPRLVEHSEETAGYRTEPTATPDMVSPRWIRTARCPTPVKTPSVRQRPRCLAALSGGLLLSIWLVSEGGLEPPCPFGALAPQASASANSATRTWTQPGS
jgi:hypothetical protein